MCDELNEEMESGRDAAYHLAEHLHAMGAQAAVLPVVIAGLDYEVMIKRRYPANTKMTYAKITELHSDGVAVLSTGKKIRGSMDAEGTYVEIGAARLYIKIGDTVSYV